MHKSKTIPKMKQMNIIFFCATDEYYLLVIQCPCEGDVTSGQIESINTTINHFH